MMNTKSFYFLGTKAAFILCMVVITACGEDDDTPAGPDLSTFERVIAQGDEIATFSEIRQVDTVAVAEAENEDSEADEEGNIERFVCTKKTVKLSDGAGQFQLFDTNADVIYPGSLLQGKTLKDATPAPIVVKRAGGTISYDLNNGNLQSTFTVDEVSKSSIQDAMNNIIATSGEVVPANFELDIIQVASEEQLAVELGIDVKVFFAKVSSDMSFSKEKKFNRTLVKLNQKYFTMSFDLPTGVEELFDPSVTPADLARFVQSDNPATFVSSVTFGRIFFMLVETTSTKEEMEASLKASFRGFGASASAELDVDRFKSLKDLKIKVIAYGGDAKGSFELAGETSVEAIANKMAESTDIRTGLPLSYVVRSVERPDQIVGTSLATEYDVVDCQLKGTLPKAGYRGLVDLFEDGIGAAVQVRLSTMAVYNKAGDKYALYNVGTAEVLGKFDVNDPNGPMGVCAFDKVGAAVKAAADLIYVFNEDGLKFQRLDYDQNTLDQNVLPTGPIGTYRDEVQVTNTFFAKNDDFPFIGDGINAGVRFIKDGRRVGGAPIYNSMLFSANGKQFMQMKIDGDKVFNNGKRENDELPSRTVPLFDQVGAAAKVFFTSNSIQLLFINEAGDQMMYWDGTAPTTFSFRGNLDITDKSRVRGSIRGPFVLK